MTSSSLNQEVVRLRVAQNTAKEVKGGLALPCCSNIVKLFQAYHFIVYIKVTSSLAHHNTVKRYGKLGQPAYQKWRFVPLSCCPDYDNIAGHIKPFYLVYNSLYWDRLSYVLTIG